MFYFFFYFYFIFFMPTGYLDRKKTTTMSFSQRVTKASTYNPSAQGAAKPIIPRSLWAWLYLLSSVVFNITIVTMEALIFAWFQSIADDKGKCTAGSDHCTPEQILAQTTPIYLALFLFAGVYQIIIGLWALRQRNTVQLLFLVFFTVAMLIYSGIQFDQIRDSTSFFTPSESTRFLSGAIVEQLLITVMCVTVAECIVQGFLTYKLYRKFTWDIFKSFGAGMNLKNALRDYLLFESLIIFDFFFFIGFTLQFIIVVLQTKDIEFALTIVVIPLTIVVLITAVLSMKREFRPGIIGFILLCFAAMAYFLFKLVRLYTATDQKRERFKRAQKTLTVFAAITLVFLILTIVASIKCMANFGIGLKETHLQRHNDRKQRQQLRRKKTLYLKGDTESQTRLHPSASRSDVHSSQISLDTLSTHLEREQRMIID